MVNLTSQGTIGEIEIEKLSLSKLKWPHGDVKVQRRWLQKIWGTCLYWIECFGVLRTGPDSSIQPAHKSRVLINPITVLSKGTQKGGSGGRGDYCSQGQ